MFEEKDADVGRCVQLVASGTSNILNMEIRVTKIVLSSGRSHLSKR